MSERDIVERLARMRTRGMDMIENVEDERHDAPQGWCELMLDMADTNVIAAAEIERLRAIVEPLTKLADDRRRVIDRLLAKSESARKGASDGN